MSGYRAGSDSMARELIRREIAQAESRDEEDRLRRVLADPRALRRWADNLDHVPGPDHDPWYAHPLLCGGEEDCR